MNFPSTEIHNLSQSNGEQSDNVLSSAHNKSDSTNVFHRSSVFGMFLTLALCLLSQPLGSLIHCQHRKYQRWSILILGLWRLNPLACFLETAAVFSTMVRVTWRLFPSDSRAGWRPPSWHTWKATIRRTASALLLLRAQKRAKDGEQILSKMILAHQFEVYGPAVRHEDYLDRNPEARPSNLGHILGSSVVAHSEILVHVISAASMAIAIIKIIASSLPWGVLIPAWFMISGWLAIQGLIALIHGLELEEDDIKEITSLATDIEKHLVSSHIVDSLFYPGFNLVKFLFAVCLTIMRVFFSEGWPPLHWYAAFAIEVVSLFMYTEFVMFMAFVCFSPIFLLWSIIILFSLFVGFSISETIVLFPLKSCWLCWDCFALYFLILTPRMASPLAVDKFVGLEKQEIGAELWLTQPIDVVLNILITIATLALGLDIYDPAQTSKPQWLDWLG